MYQEKTKYIFKRELSKFKTIGVREVSAINIINQILEEMT